MPAVVPMHWLIGDSDSVCRGDIGSGGTADVAAAGAAQSLGRSALRPASMTEMV